MTKTLNPLHFEDLEPHRFEDLVRQVVYDFRTWGSLEPTGRLGSDQGYDARGVEIVNSAVDDADEEQEEQESEDLEKRGNDERLWQIQCKRERSVGPGKIAKCVEEMIPKGAVVPYGVIFAAPTDFSKRARDVFRERLRQKGVRELYLWGKADLEDALFQPKNDHLLYAYFGISLQIQKRSQKSQLRGILSIKRKAIKHLGAIGHAAFKDILIRDIDDTHYPWRRSVPNFKRNPSWKKYFFVGHAHDGIQILVRRYFAYKDVTYGQKGEPKLNAWDFTRKNNVTPDDPWNSEPNDGNQHAVYSFWEKLDKGKQAHFEIVGTVKYENIIDIDPEGDVFASCPHVYVKRVNRATLLENWFTYKLVPPGNWGGEIHLPENADKLRIKVFPDQFPDPPESTLEPSNIESHVKDTETGH